jgi:hypothetical protein
VVLGLAEKAGHRIGFWGFTKYGLVREPAPGPDDGSSAGVELTAVIEPGGEDLEAEGVDFAAVVLEAVAVVEVAFGLT